MRKILSVFLCAALALTFCACSGPRDVSNMDYVVDFCGKQYEGAFSGTIIEGIPEGNGTFICSSSAASLEYTGTWINGKIQNGEISVSDYAVLFNDGTNREGVYVGSVVGGAVNGYGSFSAVNDEGISYSYNGEWKNGVYDGYGTVKFDSEDYYELKGTFVNGDFRPTPLEYFETEGTLPSRPFTITDSAKDFLANNGNIFLSHRALGAVAVFEENFRYEAFAKNSSKYGDKLIQVDGLYVAQIYENNYWGSDRTMCIAQDENYNVYYLFLIGTADDVYEGDYISTTALPLSYFSYPNLAGTDILAIACAAVNITKST